MINICDQCFPEGVEIGEVCTGYFLMFWKMKYHIIRGNCHQGDILLTFTTTPESDPCEGKKDKDLTDNDFDKFNEIYKKTQIENFNMSPLEGYRIIQRCLKDKIYNFKKHGYNFNFWLYCHCGTLIEEYNKRFIKPTEVYYNAKM